MKNVFTRIFLIGFIFLCLTSLSYGKTINVPGDYPTIQAGIDASSDGDIVLVADGTYRGSGNKNLDFNGKAIIVQSQNGAASTIIDCENSGRGFYFHRGENSTSVLDGFTIRNGSNPDDKGGGIFCDFSSPTIRNNLITVNSATYGGGIFCSNSTATITGNIIKGNYAGYHAGGIDCYVNASLTITNNLMIQNSAHLAAGGIRCSNAGFSFIVNNTITGNQAERGGGMSLDEGGSATLTNTILWGNSPQEINLDDDSVSITITYSDIKGGWEGEGNINTDPMFVDPDNGDYHLPIGSPCINAGTPEGAPSDDIEGNPRDAHPDMGAYEYVAPPDTTPPTPNTIASIVAISANQIDITSTEAQDDTSPVYYQIDGQYYDGSTWTDSGGGVSDYDYSTTKPNPWPDTNLAANGWYRYRQQVKDSATPPNESPWSAWFEKYTLAKTPSAPTVSNPTLTTLDVTINPNGNPSHTLFALYNITGGYYVNASGGSNGGTEVWQTKSDWGTVTVVNLTPATTYEFKGKAQNGEGIETSFGTSGSGTTAAATCPIKILPESQTIQVGDTTTINLQIEGVTNLGGFEFKLRYKTSIIEITASDIQVGVFLTHTGKQVINATPKFSREGENTVLFYGAATYGVQTPASGTGILATIALKGIGAGTTTLDLFDIQVGDANANPISVDVIDSSITVAPILYGDVSGDGNITAYDASLVLRYVVGSIELSPEQQKAADVTNNGTISALDAALILQYTVGLITKFPADSAPVAPALNSPNETQVLAGTIAQLENISLTREQKQVLEQLKNLVFSQLIPKHTALLQNYPNPFNPETWIPYELANEAEVFIRIYNTKGQLVRTLHLGIKSAGSYLTKNRAAHWNGRTQTGESASSGLYFYTIQARPVSNGIGADNFIATKRMILLK